MANKRKIVKLSNVDGRAESAEISYSTSPPWCIELHSPISPSLRRCSDNLFSCLRELRLEIEPLGWRILVNGSRIDAWVSGMAASAGGGKVYLLSDPSAVPQLVFTFDEAPIDKVVTFDEQSRWYNQLLAQQRKKWDR